MNQLKPATLATIFSEVLANLAFMFTEEEPTEPAAAGRWLEASISYHGAIDGTLRLRCTTDFTVLLAANLLGIDPQDDDAQTEALDAVKELMNVLCGQFVTAVHGEEHVFNLSIPKVRELPPLPDLSVPDGPESATLFVDTHCVQLTYAPQAV
jgi:CheY-specific phosphatase CheX